MKELTVINIKKALTLKNDIERGFVQLGKLLFEIKKNQEYVSMFESWGEFLMEMRLSESMASKLMSIYETFVLKYAIEPKQIAEAGGWTVVYDLVPLATSKKLALEWIENAKLMTRSDIKKEAMLARNLPEPEDCEHDWGKCCLKCKMRYE